MRADIWRRLSAALALTVAVCTLAGTCHAGEGLRVGGFGTLGFVVDDFKGMAPMRDIGQLFRAESDATYRLDSRLGLQLEYSLTPAATLVGQIVARDQFRGSPGSAVELAYLALSPRPDLDVRVGRINFDTFLMADHRNVGYVYPWVRPPVDFYGWIPIFSVNGADIAYHLRSEEGSTWRMTAQAGNSRFWIPIAGGAGGGYDFHAESLAGVSVARQSQKWIIKAAYAQFRIGSEIPRLAPLHQGLAQVAALGGAIGAEAADLLRNDSFGGARVGYATVGAAYDDGLWTAQAEVGRSTATATVVPHGSMAYFSLGRRVASLTPYVALGLYRPGNALRTAQNNWGGLNVALRDPAVNLSNETRIDQQTLSIGARWDFTANAAFKLQYDSTEVKRYGYGLWWADRTLLPNRNRVGQLSATIDFVF